VAALDEEEAGLVSEDVAQPKSKAAASHASSEMKVDVGYSDFMSCGFVIRLHAE
jgi:hypothetical protein